MNLAEFFKHDFNKDEFFELYNKNGHAIFVELSDEYYTRYENNENGKAIFIENSDGDTAGTPKNKVAVTDPNSVAQFFKHDFSNGSFYLYDEKGNVTFREDSYEYWARFERDENGEVIFWEDSLGNTWVTSKNKLN